MIVKPKVRGFICTTAHPEGCAHHVAKWIDYVKQHSPLSPAPKKVLIIGASTGFGLASRISLAFGGGAATLGVSFEKPPNGKRTASAGWYNTAAFEQQAAAAGLYASSINGDAFSNEIKEQTIERIQQDWDGEVDLVIYSIASPRRTDPVSGETYQAVLKPLGHTYQNKTVDVINAKVSEVTIEPASTEEVAATVKVMGGEDWALWIEALLAAGCLAKGASTVAFTYIGPALTRPIYREGTIGKAKEHLEATAQQLNDKLATAIGGSAVISVNKALVTQASAAIPVVPLYISLLYKVMKQKGVHEGCIEQMWRLFSERYFAADRVVDEAKRIRLDDWEMQADVQQAVAQGWDLISSDNLQQATDLAGYQADFYHLFGFDFDVVDYTADVDIDVPIRSLPAS